MIALVPWTIWNSEHGLGGYCIRHQGENTGKWILLASNRIRKTISRSSSSSDPQSQLSTFAPITNRLQISNCWKVEHLVTIIPCRKLEDLAAIEISPLLSSIVFFLLSFSFFFCIEMIPFSSDLWFLVRIFPHALITKFEARFLPKPYKGRKMHFQHHYPGRTSEIALHPLKQDSFDSQKYSIP
jgi:hypothetical protein